MNAFGADVKALEVRTALASTWASKTGPTVAQERDGYRLELTEAPSMILGKRGEIIGVDAWVMLFDEKGEEVRIDPHRRFINPPLQVVEQRAVYETDERGKAVTDKDGKPMLLSPRVLRHDPEAAYWEVLWQSVMGVPNAKGWRTRGTVTTVFATAPGGNGAASYRSTTYSQAREGTGTDNSSGLTHYVGQNRISTTRYCYEAQMIFDTSGVDDADDVSDVVLSLDGGLDQSTTDFTATAAASSYNGGIVDAADFVAGSALSALTTYATWASSGYSSGYNAFTSAGAAFNSAINKTGNTPIIVYSSRHSGNNDPSGAEYVVFDDADASGTTTDPKLDITHAAGGTTYFITPGGSITPAGALAKQAQKHPAGSVTPAGAETHLTGKALTGSVSPAGALTKLVSQVLAGSITPAGALVKTAQKLLTGSITPAGAIELLKVIPLAVVGSIGPAGALSRTTAKSVEGSVTPEGGIERDASKTLAGMLTPVGDVIRDASKALEGEVTPSGAVTKQTSKQLEGEIAPSGELSLTRLIYIVLEGAITPAGALVKLASKTLAGSIGPAGALSKLASKPFSGSVTPAGSATKVTGKGVGGSVTPAGGLERDESKLLAGTITPAGAVSKVTSAHYAGSVTPSGLLAKTPMKLLAAVISPAGTLVRVVGKGFAGTIALSGTLELLRFLQAPMRLLGLDRAIIRARGRDEAVIRADGADRETIRLRGEDENG